MPLYEYFCDHCTERFEVLKPMSRCGEDESCPRCGQKARKVFSTFVDIWPQILTEKSHHKGAKDEWVQDRPSNDPIVDNRKAPRVRTIF